MTKQNLFGIISFFLAVAWLEVFGIRGGGFMYAIYVLLIVWLLGFAYSQCKEDSHNN